MIGDEQAPWDLLDNETAKAYAAFVAFRDLGPRRTLAKTVPIVYPEQGNDPVTQDSAKLRTLKRWSSQYSWPARAREWDRHVDEEARLDQIEAVKEMRRRHAAVANMAVAKAAERLRNAPNNELTISDATRLLDLAVKVERLSRGEPDQMQQVTGPGGGPITVDVDSASVQALEARIRALLTADEEDSPDDPQ